MSAGKHQSNTMLIHCGDDRYTIPGHDFEQGLLAIIRKEDAALRFSPGGGFGASLEFALPETKTAWVYRLKLAPKLGIEEVIVIDHLDCGAFEIAYGEMTPEEEEAKHLETIAEAKKIVEDAGLKFTAYLQNRKDFKKVFPS